MRLIHVLIQYVSSGLILEWLNSHITHKETYFPHILNSYVSSGLILEWLNSHMSHKETS